jgi:hypothetical protein
VCSADYQPVAAAKQLAATTEDEMFKSTEKTRQRSSIWLDVDDFAGARKASRQGMVACFTVSAAASIFFALGLYGFKPWVNGWIFAAIVLFLAAAFGIKRGSRVAAVAASLLFLILVVVLIAETGRALGAGILGFIAIANGIRGTFAMDRLLKRSAARGRTSPASGHPVGRPNNEIQRTKHG